MWDMFFFFKINFYNPSNFYTVPKVPNFLCKNKLYNTNACFSYITLISVKINYISTSTSLLPIVQHNSWNYIIIGICPMLLKERKKYFIFNVNYKILQKYLKYEIIYLNNMLSRLCQLIIYIKKILYALSN